MMDDRRLVSLIAKKLDRSLNDQGGEVSDVREDNFDRYYGKPYGNEEEGYSSYVSRECLEVVEWALPSVVKVFLSSDRVVEFDAIGEDDEDQARQETDIVNHWLLRKNKGFLMLYELIKDVLMNPVAYAKVWVDEREVERIESYKGVLPPQMEAFEADEANEITDVIENVVMLDELGEEISVYDIRIKRRETLRDIVFSAMPPEEVMIDRDLTSLDCDEADFICHRVRRSFSYLVEQGFDPDELDDVTQESEKEFNDERVNRLFYEEEHPTGSDQDDDDEPTKSYWVHEIWGQFDVDEDDVAERRHILMIGDKIFENERIEYQPVVACSAIPIPHKHTGMSYIEAVKDLQLISSDLYRQLLNNVYKQNVRKTFMHDACVLDTNETMNQFLDPDNELVLTRTPPREAIYYEEPAMVITEILEAIRLVQERPQMRSGVSPQLSLDPDVLMKSTEGAFNQAMDWANQRLETLVRIFAEAAMKPIMLKAHHLARTYVDVDRQFKIHGKWVIANPRDWNTRDDMSVDVGLGKNSKQEKIQALTAVLASQREALPYGLSNLKLIYNTLERMTLASGVGPVSAFYVDPEGDDFQPPEPTPDPAMIVAEAEKMKAEAEAQSKPQKIAADIEKTQSEAQLKASEAENRAQLDQAKIEQEWQIVRQKKRELDLRERELNADIERERRLAEADANLKRAQAIKTTEETTSLGIENSDLADTLVKTVRKTNGGAAKKE